MRGRIRSIKPEVCTDEVLWDAEQTSGMPLYRLFTGLWMYADKQGRFEWRPRALKAVILPYWSGDMDSALNALSASGFIIRYEVDGRVYGAVRTFTQHQATNHREPDSKLPAPPNFTPPEHARAVPGEPGHDSEAAQADQGTRPGVPNTSGKGREGKGTEPIARAREAVRSDLEPGEPEPEEKTLPMLRRKFGSKLVERTGNPPAWTRNTVSDLQALALWLDERGGDASRLADRLLAGFFADDWAASKGFPIAAMAANPGKYLQAPSSGLLGAANGQGEADRERFDENGNYKTMIWGVR